MGHLINWTVKGISMMPKSLTRTLAGRYIAGETTESALARVQALNADGFECILDILGEDAGHKSGGSPAELLAKRETRAREAHRQYIEAATRLHAAGGKAYMSAKPTHFGLHHSEDLCFDLYSELAEVCARLGLFLRVEMEDHPTTDGTLRVFKRLLIDHDNVGIVLQSRLFRTVRDVEDLIKSVPAGRRLHVRMVKGIYLEPAKIAHTEYGPIADAYVQLTESLWHAGARVSLATHDDIMQPRLESLRSKLGITDEAFEYQVLMGVRPPLWKDWQQKGLPVRVYVPYGPDWHAYSMRRLKKNPKLLRQMAFGIFSRSS